MDKEELQQKWEDILKTDKKLKTKQKEEYTTPLYFGESLSKINGVWKQTKIAFEGESITLFQEATQDKSTLPRGKRGRRNKRNNRKNRKEEKRKQIMSIKN